MYVTYVLHSIKASNLFEAFETLKVSLFESSTNSGLKFVIVC